MPAPDQQGTNRPVELSKWFLDDLGPSAAATPPQRAGFGDRRPAAAIGVWAAQVLEDAVPLPLTARVVLLQRLLSHKWPRQRRQRCLRVASQWRTLDPLIRQ